MSRQEELGGNEKAHRFSGSSRKEDDLPSAAEFIVVEIVSERRVRLNIFCGIENVRNHNTLPRKEKTDSERIPRSPHRLVLVRLAFRSLILKQNPVEFVIALFSEQRLKSAVKFIAIKFFVHIFHTIYLSKRILFSAKN